MRYTPLATDALYPMPYALCPMPARAPHVTEKGYNSSYESLKVLHSRKSRLVKDENYHSLTLEGPKVDSNCCTAA